MQHERAQVILKSHGLESSMNSVVVTATTMKLQKVFQLLKRERMFDPLTVFHYQV